ncbi:MAG: MalY/PatB family protein [Paludibacter sp.]
MSTENTANSVQKNYNFDEIIDRHHTDAIKIERCKALFGTENVLPLWVADMDFRTPDFILESIQKRCEHPILGYSMLPKGFIPALTNWIKELHQWEVKREWVGFLPGIVSGIAFAVETFSEVGDEIIIQPPVYYPFIDVVNKNNRQLICNQLKEMNGKFEMDFEDLEKKITTKTRMFILCNPHNPGGRAWDKETLNRLAEICSKNNIVVISDEIHSDLVLHGQKHIPFASISETAANISLTYMAPTKTFNMPGLVSSSYIIPNAELRSKFVNYLEKTEQTGGNIFAYVATQAAYENGREWRKQMLEYVQGNIDFVVEFLKQNIPQVKPMIPEATYLIWLDCKDLGMETDDLQSFFVHKAGLGLNKGTIFGVGGEYHLRLNSACPRSILEKAMKQLFKAVESGKLTVDR